MAAGVHHDVQAGRAGGVKDAAIARLEDPPPDFWRDHQAVLEAPVVAEANAIDTHALELSGGGTGEIGELVGRLLHEGLIAQHIAQVVLKTAEPPSRIPKGHARRR